MFSPTQKQLLAIENLERFLWVKDAKKEFTTFQIFQRYFDSLKSDADKKSAKTTLPGIIWTDRKQPPKIIKKDELREDAILYINRYFPSKLQLMDYLRKITKQEHVVVDVFKEVEKYIDEEKMIENLMDQMKRSGVDKSDISQKLYNKKFDGDLIKKFLSKEEWYSLKDKINYYKEKWKTKNWIFMHLFEKWAKREELNSLLDDIFEKQIE